ncbi:MAG: acetyl/propionyl/methylcrotonyl-CoA carboxylase subunit alpha [Alphaproteobacteria bacterium]|nr:acetyl/propionyl/methylcrotonyl-CoA carboxylase subunit alpha [Alphaproteobacteria bacterium]
MLRVMFKKILIANRGEIACRIIRSCKKMKIKTVAVYSEADTNALHVRMADEALYIGSSPAPQSYLHLENLLDAVMQSGAQGVHPGYGFLSENCVLAEELAAQNVAFIGPNINAIRLMGDKIEAKKLAKNAGVSTVPGYMGVIKNEKEAIKIANDIGYPVMIKAAAGGGGKGMRVVHTAKEVPQAFSSASNEARNSFSDGRIFIEKFIQNPRHIEIQVLADKHGNVVCLGERECSIQRHHQKVIEEAPSPFLDAKTRQSMYKQSIALAKKVGYDSAGTIEFIVDQKKNFYFLEMNTRLQVEHCVTEQITGIDIVEQMIRVAAGEKLPFTQSDIELKGWSIESRIYAEDPSRGFMPSSGRLIQYQEPTLSDTVRVDSGVYEGGEVSMFYDAMIAKLITHGKDRNEAIQSMRDALGEFVISGISHNISFLEAVMANDRFVSGKLSTSFIAEEYPDGFEGADLTNETTKVFLAAAVHLYLTDAERSAKTSGQIPGRSRQIGTVWGVYIDDNHYTINTRKREAGYDIVLETEIISIRSNWTLGTTLFKGRVNGKLVNIHIEPLPVGYRLTHAGSSVIAAVHTPRIAELTKFMPTSEKIRKTPELCAPISGMVVDVKVKEGEEVKAGQDLVIIEAMKMENIIFAESDETICAVRVKKGDSVSVGQQLLEFEIE